MSGWIEAMAELPYRLVFGKVCHLLLERLDVLDFKEVKFLL